MNRQTNALAKPKEPFFANARQKEEYTKFKTINRTI
jgi:hypothetical protein